MLGSRVWRLGIGVDIGQQNLHGFNAVRNEVADFKDLAHTAATEQRQDFVITDGFADFQFDGERRHTSSLMSILQTWGKSSCGNVSVALWGFSALSAAVLGDLRDLRFCVWRGLPTP